jgi:hypothetical protein
VEGYDAGGDTRRHLRSWRHFFWTNFRPVRTVACTHRSS